MGRYMAIIEAWTTLAATQCSVAKDGTFEETPLVDIIATIISPHNRPYTGLCFPQSWDPTRPLKLENNHRDKLNNYYGVPVTCECNYEIPQLKGLPKAKKDKSTDDKNVKKTKTDKTKDAAKPRTPLKLKLKVPPLNMLTLRRQAIKIKTLKLESPIKTQRRNPLTIK